MVRCQDCVLGPRAIDAVVLSPTDVVVSSATAGTDGSWIVDSDGLVGVVTLTEGGLDDTRTFEEVFIVLAERDGVLLCGDRDTLP